MKKLFLIIILLPFLNCAAQEVKVKKIIDSNLLLLDNGRKVMISELSIPDSLKKSFIFGDLNNEILQWEQAVLLENTFDVNYIDSLDSGVWKVKLGRKYLMGNEDVAEMFISNGYAYYLPSDANSTDSRLLRAEKNAAERKNGLWKYLAPEYLEKRTSAYNDRLFKALSERHTLTAAEMTTYSEMLKFRNITTNNFSAVDNLSSTVFSHNISIREYRRLPFLSLSIASFIGSYYFFHKAQDKMSAIDMAEIFRNGTDTHSLKKDRNAAIWAGIGCSLVGIASTIYALTPVEVYINPTQLSLKYNF